MTLQIVLMLLLFIATFLSLIEVYDNTRKPGAWALLLISVVLVIKAVL